MCKKNEDEIDELLSILNLKDKADELATNLSGGQQRKLSIAMALINSAHHLIILDEPSSGMDIQSRRQIHILLQKYKKNRLILLSTHYMNEANVLSDKIAILKDGYLQCYGTCNYLKKIFNLGQIITISIDLEKKKKKIFDHENEKKIFGGKALQDQKKAQNYQQIQSEIINIFQNKLQLIHITNGEIKYKVLNSYIDIFQQLESLSNQYQPYINYSISDATLDQIFLQSNENNDKSNHQLSIELNQVKNKQLNLISSKCNKHNKQHNLITLLYLKRFKISFKDLKGRFYELCIPLIFISIILMILKCNYQVFTGPKLALNMNNLKNTKANGFDLIYSTHINNYNLSNCFFNESDINYQFKNINNSYNMTNYMYDDINYGHVYGGILFNDSLTLTINDTINPKIQDYF